MLLVPLGAQSSDWAHDAVNLTHEYGDGSGVKVGVLDELALCTHQELAGHCQAWRPVGYDNLQAGDHGTHVSSIIAGIDKAPGWLDHDGGIAPGATILSYGLFSSSGGWLSDEIEIDSAAHAHMQGASVINQSYGAYDNQGYAAFIPAVTNIWKSHKKLTFVYAAGNEGTLIDQGNVKGIDNVIFVGATDSTGKITYWSNTPGNNYKDQFIVAPGDFISGAGAQNNSDYVHMSGTSMAAPMVTGAVALLHSQWKHLKKDPEATAQILYETATDLGAAGVDAVYGHGMLNIGKAMSPVPVDNGGDDGGDTGGDTGGDDEFVDTGGDEGESCHHDGGSDTVTNPGNDCPWWGCYSGGTGQIGTSSLQGRYAIRTTNSGNRSSYTGPRDDTQTVVLDQIKTNRVVHSAASQLDVVFFDKFDRDFMMKVAEYKPMEYTSKYVPLSDNLQMQLTSGSPNFKVNLSDVTVGHGKSFGFNHHAVLDTLDDGVYVANDKVGVMYSDTSTTGLYMPQDWLTLTYTDEKGFLGSSGGGAFSFGEYQTASATLDKDYGLFFGSVTAATSVGDGGRGVVRMSDTVNSVAFNAGIKGTVSDSLNWKFSVGQDLQPIDGRMSVSYIDYSGRSVLQSVELDENRRTKFQFNLNYTW